MNKAKISIYLRIRMAHDTIQISCTADTIGIAAHELWQYAQACPVWVFSGEMGAGKTTQIRAVCNVLDIRDRVSSPTFSLINEYHFPSDRDGAPSRVIHMDWYRLKDAAEAIQAGMEDAWDGAAYCFIEWPERAMELLPPEHVWITIHIVSEQERMIHARKVQRGADTLDQ